jgi:hypothetical protein
MAGHGGLERGYLAVGGVGLFRGVWDVGWEYAGCAVWSWRGRRRVWSILQMLGVDGLEFNSARDLEVYLKMIFNKPQ